MRIALALLLSLGGCADRAVRVKPPAGVPIITVPRYCIESIELTPKAECTGPDGKLACTGINVTFRPSCALVAAPKGK